MYICYTCNARFSAPNEYYQTHSFDFAPYELFRECPECSSTYITELSQSNQTDKRNDEYDDN